MTQMPSAPVMVICCLCASCMSLHFDFYHIRCSGVTLKRISPYPHSFAKRVVYTCVFGPYDFVIPPKVTEPETDYILICDDSSLKVKGWKLWVMDPATLGGNMMANRYFKFFAHELFPHCDYSCYLDGNLRIIGLLDPLFTTFAKSKSCLGLSRHRFRSRVADEIIACNSSGKLSSLSAAESELKFYQTQGFDDSVPLTENNVLLRWHLQPALAGAMELWWDCFSKFKTRDQISLPFVRWKTDLNCYILGYIFHDPNPYLHIHRHRTKLRRSNLLRYCEARKHDSWILKLLFSIGHRYEHSSRTAKEALNEKGD